MCFNHGHLYIFLFFGIPRIVGLPFFVRFHQARRGILWRTSFTRYCYNTFFRDEIQTGEEKEPGEVPKASSGIGGTWHQTCVMTEKITHNHECFQRSSWIVLGGVSQTWKTAQKVVRTTCVIPTWTHKLNLPWPLWLSATTTTDDGEQQRDSEGG